MSITLLMKLPVEAQEPNAWTGAFGPSGASVNPLALPWVWIILGAYLAASLLVYRSQKNDRQADGKKTYWFFVPICGIVFLTPIFVIPIILAAEDSYFDETEAYLMEKYEIKKIETPAYTTRREARPVMFKDGTAGKLKLDYGFKREYQEKVVTYELTRFGE